MAFVFTETARFEWPVTVYVPQGGDHVGVEITGFFAMIDDEEFFGEDTVPTTTAEGIEAEITKLMKVFKGWKDGDVLDLKGKEVDPTEATIRQFLGQRPARLAVTQAYAEATTPTKGFRAKN